MGLLDNSDLAGAGVGLIGTLYNMYTNHRDFDYQKALQQQMFQREDTAVQRRVEDLKAAGLNPALANGSAAGAGSVVSRSNTNDVNMGAALDMIQAVNQIRLQKQQQANQAIENQILKDTEYVKDNEKYISMAQTLAQLGVPFHTNIGVSKDGKTFDLRVSPTQAAGLRAYLGPDSKLQQLLDYQTSSAKNSATLLQNDVDFYTGDKVAGYMGIILSILNKLK